jgi:hypothetical protein
MVLESTDLDREIAASAALTDDLKGRLWIAKNKTFYEGKKMAARIAILFEILVRHGLLRAKYFVYGIFDICVYFMTCLFLIALAARGIMWMFGLEPTWILQLQKNLP